MEPARWLPVAAITGILGVVYGGWALLTFVTGKEGLTAAHQRFFRDGHAHAGVLLVLSLVYFRYLGATSFPRAPRGVPGPSLLLGAMAQSGGFFLPQPRAGKDA